MNDPSSLLRAADPLGDESEHQELSAADAQAIRRAMLAAIPAATVRPIWRRPVLLAAAAALVASVSGAVGHRLATRSDIEPVIESLEAPVTAGDSERRQLQFATPGGTRIIWVFDDNLRFKEPMP